MKVHFRIAIKTVSNLTSGKDVILMWRRGSRKRAGALHEVKVCSVSQGQTTTVLFVSHCCLRMVLEARQLSTLLFYYTPLTTKQVQGNEATWNQEFSVSCKYHDDVDRASLPTKQLTLLVKEVTVAISSVVQLSFF